MGPSLVDTTSMQRSTFHKLSSNQAIRIVSASCCTVCPRLDGPSDHMNERAGRSESTIVTLLNYICKGLCPLSCVYRLRLLQDHIAVFLQISFVRCSVLHPSLQIARHSIILLSLKRSDSRYLAFRHVFNTFNCPLNISGAWASSINLTHHIFYKGVASCTDDSRLVRRTVLCGKSGWTFRHCSQLKLNCVIIHYSALFIGGIPVSVRVLMRFPIQPALFPFH